MTANLNMHLESKIPCAGPGMLQTWEFVRMCADPWGLNVASMAPQEFRFVADEDGQCRGIGGGG